MSATAHKTDEEKKEYFDTPEELDLKVTQLAEWIKESKHFVAFTGAGISTSAGIPDFRSGVNTVLKTGPGAWEKAATGKSIKPKVKVAMSQALPTPSHMALCALEKAGYLKFLISQNVDGLHRKSGFPVDKMAEVHGNTNLEICKSKKCGRQYMRDFRVRNAQKVHDHQTGRKCESCGGMLYDTIINFGENLPEKELENGFNHSQEADLCLVLGSSLRVTPAADMPYETAKRNGRLVIVNLQATPLDNYALRINGMIDDVISLLMKKLQLPTPPFQLLRRLAIRRIPASNDSKKNAKDALMLRGIDSNGDPYSLFPQVDGTFLKNKEAFSSKKEPFMIVPQKASLEDGMVRLNLQFQGYYDEPGLTLDVNLADVKTKKDLVIEMAYDPIVTRQWGDIRYL
mmetsp:Transcript_52433/g.60235  ORF Transcript_52433/g.60235 Transcript_52433/m.60235 type:complete len:400 (+) Transcript_52433:50-1249(+)